MWTAPKVRTSWATKGLVVMVVCTLRERFRVTLSPAVGIATLPGLALIT